jgi:CheY-like chemotaxis protein
MEGNWFASLQSADIPVLPIFARPEWNPKGPYPSANEHEAVDRGKKARIIVIDDEGVIAETVVEILKQEGYEAIAVATGNSAVELARTWMPDIVLSDVIMPGLNGIETGILIREIAPQCKIILFSGQAATVDLLQQARENGYRFDILAKPIKPEQLILVIRAAAGPLA